MRVALCRNQSGLALVGIMVTVFIVAALVYGGVFFSKDDTNPRMNMNNTNVNSPVGAIKALDQAKKDIEEINKTTEEVVSDSGNKIEILNIEIGGNLASPLAIEGEGSSESGSLIVELRNQEHETMVKELVEVKANKGEKGLFKITLNFEFSSTKEGFLAVYEDNDKDNLLEIPVKFENINK